MTVRPIKRTLGRRERLTGRRESGEYFAMLTLEVIESTAFGCLPDYATRVLVVLASKYRGANNGDLELTEAYAAKRGINGKKLYAALDLLQRVGLIAKTRQGGRRPLGPSLYALEWHKVNASSKYDSGNNGTQAPRNTWASWVPPADWRNITKQALTKQRGGPSRARARLVNGRALTAESHSPREERTAPTVGGTTSTN